MHGAPKDCCGLLTIGIAKPIGLSGYGFILILLHSRFPTSVQLCHTSSPSHLWHLDFTTFSHHIVFLKVDSISCVAHVEILAPMVFGFVFPGSPP